MLRGFFIAPLKEVMNEGCKTENYIIRRQHGAVYRALGLDDAILNSLTIPGLISMQEYVNSPLNFNILSGRQVLRIKIIVILI